VKPPLDEIQAFRAQELLLQRATEGLSEAEAAELAALGADDDVSFDLAAAAVDLATLAPEALPRGVADKVLLAAGVRPSQPAIPTTLAGVAPPRPLGGTPAGTREAPEPVAPVLPLRRRSRAPMIVAWVAAAAGIALAIGAVLWARAREVEPIIEYAERVEPTPAEARAKLLADAGDVQTLAWSVTGDPAAEGARGDVVWSRSRQEGYMRFVGLSPNDPKLAQYQLWIFDQEREQDFPVDGGVFDVGEAGEVIVKIDPKLFVREPVLFAVTVERPGGVVVSKRERIVVTAAPKQG
jgi:hypothetical protein